MDLKKFQEAYPFAAATLLKFLPPENEALNPVTDREWELHVYSPTLMLLELCDPGGAPMPLAWDGERWWDGEDAADADDIRYARLLKQVTDLSPAKAKEIF